MANPIGRGQREKHGIPSASLQPYVDVSPITVPPPPTGLRKSAKERWQRLWEAPQSAMFADMPHLHPVLERLVRLYDEEERLAQIAKRDPTVVGSMGQERMNPAYDLLNKTRDHILKLEREIGATPQAMLRLGIRGAIARKNAPKRKEPVAKPDPRLNAV